MNGFFPSFHSISFSNGSYLDTPRLHFSGHFRADAATTNNMPCNFDANLPYDEVLNKDWNSVGTNEFSFIDTHIAGAVSNQGSAMHDEVIGARVMDNGKQPFAKMVILDVDTENTTAIYGMVFGVSWGDTSEDIAFKGKWTPNIIAQNLWDKVKCYYGDQDTFPRGAQATTTITDIVWGNLKGSSVLSELKEASDENGRTLQVSVSFYFYTRNYEEFVQSNFTLGYVTGTIGIYKEGEPLSYGGERLLSPDGLSAPPLTFSQGDSCYKKNPKLYNPWMFNAPFKVNEDHKVVTVDLSNSFPISLHSSPRDIGDIYLGLMHESAKCIELIGPSIPYLDSDWLNETSSVIDIPLNNEQFDLLMTSPSLVVVRLQNTNTGYDVYKICGDLHSAEDNAKMMLRETIYYVRPSGFYNARLVYPNSKDMSFYVTYLGRSAFNITVKMATYRSVLPTNGIVVEEPSKQTDANGIATFTFKVTTSMNTTREYEEPPCPNISNTTNLPIDGQSYQFKYYVCTDVICPKNPSKIDETPITIRAFSNIQYYPPYTWDDHVKPILTQYYHLYPVMNSILNLSNYYSVTFLPNRQLMKIAMSQDFNDANFMPATRDLPPSQQAMILEWLDNPLKNLTKMDAINIDDHTPELLPVPNCTEPQRPTAMSDFSVRVAPYICGFNKIPYNPEKFCDFYDDYYFQTLKGDPTRNEKRRPLYGYRRHSNDPCKTIGDKCTLPNLQIQLQQAVELEFATLPLYLTSLYTIIEGCNPQVYELIRSVVMQEMLHMAQSSNILIAINKQPVIDSSDTAPKYPGKGLPGGVHPNLLVNLEKASLEHIHDVFVAIEQPNVTCVAQKYPVFANNTVGQFYSEIAECIKCLGDDIFNASTEDIQVSWPWTPSDKLGKLYKVKDVNTAIKGINEIIDQGEGASPVDPNDSSDTLAHFYRFQEIVCQRKLIKVDEKHYAYRGDSIPFDPKGIWPMRDNPSKKHIEPNTNCYTEAKAFHHVYRALLRELQATFGGEPDRITTAVEIMESLLVHAKRVVRVPFDPDDDVLGLTCGPVWDYDWND